MPSEIEQKALDALHLAEDVEGELLAFNARRALSLEFNNGRDERELRTAQEQLRGKQTLLKHANKELEDKAHYALSREFNPDHVDVKQPNERLRRDEYRNRMQAQVKK